MRRALLFPGTFTSFLREFSSFMKTSPGIEDVWQIHHTEPRARIACFLETSDPGGTELNTTAHLIANPDDTTEYNIQFRGPTVASSPRMRAAVTRKECKPTRETQRGSEGGLNSLLTLGTGACRGSALPERSAQSSGRSGRRDARTAISSSDEICSE